jgi:hypothetical protein
MYIYSFSLVSLPLFSCCVNISDVCGLYVCSLLSASVCCALILYLKHIFCKLLFSSLLSLSLPSRYQLVFTFYVLFFCLSSLCPSLWIFYLYVSCFPLSSCPALFPLSLFHLNSLICLLFYIYTIYFLLPSLSTSLLSLLCLRVPASSGFSY